MSSTFLYPNDATYADDEKISRLLSAETLTPVCEPHSVEVECALILGVHTPGREPGFLGPVLAWEIEPGNWEIMCDGFDTIPHIKETLLSHAEKHTNSQDVTDSMISRAVIAKDASWMSLCIAAGVSPFFKRQISYALAECFAQSRALWAVSYPTAKTSSSILMTKLIYSMCMGDNNAVGEVQQLLNAEHRATILHGKKAAHAQADTIACGVELDKRLHNPDLDALITAQTYTEDETSKLMPPIVAWDDFGGSIDAILDELSERSAALM